MDFFNILFTPQGLLYLVILSLLEIVLGIDNIIFISIVTDKLPIDKKRIGRNLGLTLALLVRLFLLALVSWMMSWTKPLFTIAGINFTGESLVLLVGGIFLIYKSSMEMYENVKGTSHEMKSEVKTTLSGIVTQIVLIDIVFSFDSIITAIGMTKDISPDPKMHPMIIIYLAVIISMIIMLLFAKYISEFINSRPTVKMLALSFLVMIGIVLVAEAFGENIPKGYVYFAMAYALVVEMLNIRMRKNMSN